MAEKRMIERYPLGDRCYDFSAPTGDIKDVIKELTQIYTKHVKKGPYESLKLWTSGSDEDDNQIWYISGKRLQTDEEFEAELKATADRENKHEAEEREDLKRLQEKYK